MKELENSNDPQKLFCASNWMGIAIQVDAAIVYMFQSTLKTAGNRLKKKAKRGLSRIDIASMWMKSRRTRLNNPKPH